MLKIVQARLTPGLFVLRVCSLKDARTRALRLAFYCEIGGAGGPAGATGGAADAATGAAGDGAGAAVPSALSVEDEAGVLLEAGGAGVTAGTGSARSGGGAGGCSDSFEASGLASDLAASAPAGAEFAGLELLWSEGLPDSSLAAGASDLPASVAAAGLVVSAGPEASGLPAAFGASFGASLAFSCGPCLPRLPGRGLRAGGSPSVPRSPATGVRPSASGAGV